MQITTEDKITTENLIGKQKQKQCVAHVFSTLLCFWWFYHTDLLSSFECNARRGRNCCFLTVEWLWSRVVALVPLTFSFHAGSVGCQLLWMSQWVHLFSDLWFRKLHSYRRPCSPGCRSPEDSYSWPELQVWRYCVCPFGSWNFRWMKFSRLIPSKHSADCKTRDLTSLWISPCADTSFSIFPSLSGGAIAWIWISRCHLLSPPTVDGIQWHLPLLCS